MRHPSYHPNMVAEHGCDTSWRALQEQTSEKICEQIVDVRVPQVVEQVLEVPNILKPQPNLAG